MSIPAVVAVRKKYRDARIVWLVEGSVSRFLSCQNFIDEVIEFPRSSIVKDFIKGNFISAGKRINNFLKELRKTEYDIVVDFHGIIKSAIFSMITRTSRRVGFGRMYAKEKSHLFYHDRVEGTNRRLHKVERNMLLARRLGAKGLIPEIDLSVRPEDTQYVERFLADKGISSPAYAINPFSSKGNTFKRWEVNKYVQLIKKIRSNGIKDIIILWGPGEEDEAKELQKKSGEGVYLSCPTNVPQLLALLKRMDMYIGGDTGVMHLAAFAGTPVVAIFGPTDVKINGPYGRRNTVIRRDLVCSPCKDKGRDCTERKCLTGITVNQVYNEVLAMEQNT